MNSFVDTVQGQRVQVISLKDKYFIDIMSMGLQCKVHSLANDDSQLTAQTPNSYRGLSQ